MGFQGGFVQAGRWVVKPGIRARDPGRYINLRVLSTEVVFKTMKLDEVTKEMHADRKGGIFKCWGDEKEPATEGRSVGGSAGGRHKGNSQIGVSSWPARLADPGGWCWAGGHWV